MLPASLPRAGPLEALRADPLRGFAEARARGDLVVLREGGPLLSGAPGCAGAVAAFGAGNVRSVLGDIEAFGMPASAAERLALPPALAKLNAGAHSMRGERHAQHQRALLRVLGERAIAEREPSLIAGLESFARSQRPGGRTLLLSAMRDLALETSSRLLFGEAYPERAALAELARAWFHLRREAAAPFAAADAVARDALVEIGTALDASLRAYLRWCRGAGDAAHGVLGELARLELAPGSPLAEDALVAHGNVLFLSSNEPIAVALTWTLLILSQLPRLRRALRHELEGARDGAGLPPLAALARLPLLDAVLSETLRLLTPNALMVRLTTRPVTLGGAALPEATEILLCPFIAHRDPARFPEPDAFRPARWRGAAPSPFEYFPFGGGGHHCVGRSFALPLLKAALAFLLARWDIVLASDQAIGWRIHILFMPSDEPMVTLRDADAPPRGAGKLLGAVGALVDLADDDSRY